MKNKLLLYCFVILQIYYNFGDISLILISLSIFLFFLFYSNFQPNKLKPGGMILYLNYFILEKLYRKNALT